MNEERQTCQMGCKVTNQLELKMYQPKPVPRLYKNESNVGLQKKTKQFL